MLTVASYNIRHARGIDGKVNLRRIATVLGTLNTDVIALQEVDRWVVRSRFRNQPGFLAQCLGMEYAFGPNVRWQYFQQYGNAVLSRLPIVERLNRPLPSKREQRGLLICRVNGPQGVISFCSTHLGLDAGERLEQTRAIARVLRNDGGPLILAGDFNCHGDAAELEPIKQFMIDTAVDGEPYTYPSDRPRVKPDYIFYLPGFRVTALSAIPTLASDHLPLVVTLEQTRG